MINSLSAETAYSEIINNKDLLIIDVRTTDEFSKNRIKDSKNIPIDSFEKEISNLNIDKSKKILVYCLSGSRSIIASEILERLGYKNIYDIKNGLLGWRAKKLPLEIS